MNVGDKIRAFRESISSNLLADGDFIDWGVVEQQIEAFRPATIIIQQLLNEREINLASLIHLLDKSPSVYPLLLDLIAFNSSGGQVEKWGLPQLINNDAGRTAWVAGQLLHIGLDRILTRHAHVEQLLRVAEVYKDSYRRRFRSAGQLDVRMRHLITNAVRIANAGDRAIDPPIRINAEAVSDSVLRRSLSFVLAVGNRPIAGVATVFQNQSGGRQQRDLSVTYPNLQERLDAVGMALILVADGQGLKEASDRTLTALFEGVRHPMTLASAESGALVDAIISAAVSEAPRGVEKAALDQIIADALRTRLVIHAEDLPVRLDQARLALASFVDSRRLQALELGHGGSSVTWAHRSWVERARSLRHSFQAGEAIALFAELLGDHQLAISPQDTTAILIPPNVQPFAARLQVAAGGPLTPDSTRAVAQRSMEHAPASPVTVYLMPHSLDAAELQIHRKGQIFLPTNIIILSPDVLESMARRRRPLQKFMDVLLAQSDLTKVSPYVLNNATPARMFYGREREAATVLQTIPTNSIAILGSRRIGKTSLIRRLQEELGKARFQTFFGDCQTVRTWSDFADLARRNWQADLPKDFRPNHVADLVAQLRARGVGQVIIILDEIDQLIDWDQAHSADSVPEAFFRACRSVSQEGAAHFVFSGERRIANRLWDPHSPHWNFCREVQLTQLQQADAVALLMEPLRVMNIEIFEPAAFEAEAWNRTSGHPQIVQFLGDRLVRSLDNRNDRRNLTLGVADIVSTTETFEFADHYLSTYWGQASVLERAVSRAVAAGAKTSAEIIEALPATDEQRSAESLFNALRMLELYGIIEEREGSHTMRATWFADALAHFNN